MDTEPLDYYLLKQQVFEMRIVETKRYISWLKNRKGLARHKARDKIKEVEKTLVMLESMKEEDCLPWEPGPTFEVDVTGHTLNTGIIH